MPPFHVREATAADHDAYCRLLPELRTGDPAPTPERWATRMAPETLVVEADGGVIATCWVRNLGAWAHVVHVIVDPAWQGRGVGKRLMHAVAQRLRREGSTHWYLNVKRDNAPALRLYASVGLGRRVESVALKIPWTIVPSLPTRTDAPAPAPLEPDADRAFEDRFDLVPGSIAAARARDELPIHLGTSALAVFNPTFPGAWCFRVAAPDLARPLLEALRPHAPADVDHVMAMTDDAPAAELLVAHGAELRLELYRLSGSIPVA